MFWPSLCLLLLAALAGLHFWWRARCRLAEAAARQKLEALEQARNTAAQEARTHQAALFDSMLEGLLLLDEHGRVQLANRACTNFFGLSGDVRGKTLMEALRLHELAELVDSLATHNQVLGHELKLSRPNERWIEANGAAVVDGTGRRLGTVLVFHDLTRLKKLERTREEFVANVSHELRTPLSLIKGYVETLLDGARDNPEVAAKFLNTIDRNAERLKLLIEDLLTISELESGRLRLNLQSTDLRSTVDKVLGDLRTRAGKKQAQLVSRVPAVRVRADPGRLEQVLGNLLDNAIKYGRTGGVVTVDAQPGSEGHIEVCVRDDGPGIPVESLERVFERFYRVDKARSREQGGTGLGLSIVKHIVQNHGGRVWVRSEPGHGAAFYFTLPQDSGSFQQPLR